MKILGVEMQPEKHIVYALCKIRGIGLSLAKTIVNQCNIKINKLSKDLNIEEIGLIENYINQHNILTESLLFKYINNNIRTLEETQSYRGFRHALSLPSRGQRTSSNAKTCKKKRKKDIKTSYTIFMSKIKIKKNRKNLVK